MTSDGVHQISGKLLIALSVIALITVVSGYFQAPQVDEGIAAHIFQLAVAAALPTVLLFVVTIDGKQQWQSVRPLTVSATVFVVAFAALFYLEHYFYVQR